ncbi:DENN domain-containing protein 1A isoform X11 [Musca autumnalis]|uniref:DENN domain-containing protein 1A isoform X11 n=1 Tax=Musca autumnalis TaxID=221902 RepID=UPI003CFB0EB8
MSSRNKTDVKKLFEYWCEVSRTHGGIEQTNTSRHNGGGSYSGAPVGVITESFPESFRDEKTIHDIPAFAFPCEFESDSVQSYSFVLTTDDSKWRFGFCRHDPKTESTMVIITLLPWHDTFLRLLAVLAELRRTDPKEFQQFLSDAYNGGVPDVGSQLKLVYSQGQSQFIFERPKPFQLPSIPENHNLNLYYNFVDPKNMIAVFAAMLAERRIIFTSRRLDRLSSCIQAANAFLYPMVWQHIFIPVLPMKLKDYLSAPMPYLIGVPHLVLETMTPEELGEVVTLNCDTKIFDSPFDDVHAMPAEIVSQMKKQLSHSNQHMGDRVSKIFLGVLVQLIGGYRDAVEFRGPTKTFNRDKFIESRPSHLRPFLTKMMELQIFQQFIDERLEMMSNGLGLSDEFELETVRYAEKLKKRGRFHQLKEKSLRSLQPQHMTLGLNDTTTTTIASANTSTDAGSHSNASEESMKDLISLDDSHNSSFDLEDFDPLNQNARPLPTLGKVMNSQRNKSTTLPATASRTPPASFITAANNSISNPLYTFYTPQHMATSMTAAMHAPLTRTTQPPTLMQQQQQQQLQQPSTPPSEIPPPLPKSVPPPMPPPDEDFELLRKYGLDQFTLITTSVTATSNSTTTMAGTTSSQQNGLTTTGMQNWTTFD